MNHFKQLCLEIETNRQRLQFAIDTGNEDLKNRTLSLLVRLQASFFDLLKGSLTMDQNETYYLVFSTEHMDGRRMSLSEYREFTRRLALVDTFDLKTHVAIAIQSGMEPAVDQLLFNELRTKNGKAS